MTTRILSLLMLALFLVQCGYFTDLGTNVEKSPAALYGWVKDSLSGKPIPNATVRITNQEKSGKQTRMVSFYWIPFFPEKRR